MHRPLRLGEIPPGGLRYSGPLSLRTPFPLFWLCWKFRVNSAWMKTSSIFVFPLKSVSVLSLSQAYHLPLQTHLQISLATRHRNMQKISCGLKYPEFPEKYACFQMYFVGCLQSHASLLHHKEVSFTAKKAFLPLTFCLVFYSKYL